MTDEQIQRTHKENRTLEWVISGAVGLFSGFTGLVAQTRTQFHRKLVSFIRGKDDDLFDHATQARHEMNEAYKEHGRTLDNLATDRMNGVISTREFLNDSYRQKNIFSRKLSDFTETELGIASSGIDGAFKGSWQRFKFMGNYTRVPIIINAAIATTVGAAGTMMFFNSLNVHNKLDILVNRQQQQDSTDR